MKRPNQNPIEGVTLFGYSLLFGFLLQNILLVSVHNEIYLVLFDNKILRILEYWGDLFQFLKKLWFPYSNQM